MTDYTITGVVGSNQLRCLWVEPVNMALLDTSETGRIVSTRFSIPMESTEWITDEFGDWVPIEFYRSNLQ